jgi:tetratricopeptide (TPR) repeat protein
VLAPLTPVDPADPTTIDQDVADQNESPDAARLRQGIEADLANDHGSKADAYVAVLTILAVALFLLGLSLTVHGRARYILAAPGVFIALVCVAWSAFISGRHVTEVSERSIRQAAEGQRLQDSRDLDGAIDAYDAAIDDSPDFAAAFARRASARFLQGSPQTGQTTFVSITSEEALEDALADLDEALALGADTDVNTVAQAGFFHFLAGDFDRSVQLSSDAIDLNESLAPVWFNLGVAQIAGDDEDGARRSYRQGLRLVDDLPDAGTRAAIVAGARTDLSILRELLDDDELDDVDDLIVDHEVELATFELERATCGSGDDLAPCESVDDVDDIEVGDAELSRSGAFVFASIPVEGLAAGDDVGTTWYFRTDDSLPFEQAFLGFVAGEVGDDGTLLTSTLPTINPACPIAGEFLVRLYAGEELLGEAGGSIDATLVGNDFAAFADPIEGFEACVPEGFEVNRADINDLDGFTTFGSLDSDVLIGVNVTPGGLGEGVDPDLVADQVIEGIAPDGERSTAQLSSRTIDGDFVFIDAEIVVDEDAGVAAAIAFGPDSSSRNVVITGEVSLELLLEIIGLVTFTGVGT